MVRAGAQPAPAGCVTDLAIGSNDKLERIKSSIGRRIKQLLESKSKRRLSHVANRFEPQLRLFNRRNRSEWNPPECQMRYIHFFKPVLTPCKEAPVHRSIDIVPQRWRVRPNGHIHDDSRIIKCHNRCSISRVGLESPNEPRTRFSESIDFV